MFDDRENDFKETLKKYVSENHDTWKAVDVNRGSTLSADIRISKSTKDHCRIIINKKQKDDDEDDERKCDTPFESASSEREIREIEVNS